ncbi:MAG: hypothetical protein ACKO3W_07540 [bacterium]
MISRTLLTSLLAASLTATALAQTAGGGLDASVTGATGTLTEAQKASVSKDTAGLVDTLKSSDSTPKQLDEARTALVKPARDPGATLAFRSGYAATLKPALEPMVTGDDLQRAIIAMQVLRFTRSSTALDILVERTNPASEVDPGKRIAAGTLLIDIFDDYEGANNTYDGAARKIRDAAAAETDWMALQQKLNALGAAARRKDLPADNARTVRRAQAEAIGKIAAASKGATAADQRMKSLQRVLVGIRNDLLTMPQADRSTLAKVLAPALADTLAATAAQWDAAHGSKELGAAYASTVNSCEVILRLIDRAERPSAYAGTKPETDARVLATSWDAKDRAKFDAEVKRWAGVVSAAPYKN